MKPSRELMQAPTCTVLDILRECPAAIVTIAFVWAMTLLLGGLTQ